MGDYAKAEPLYPPSPGDHQAALGENHPDYATSLNNLATLYKAMGDYTKAEPLCRQVAPWQIRKRRRWARTTPTMPPKPEQPGCRAVRGHGRLREGRAALPPSPGDQEAVLGENHPDYAISLNNLARLYKAMGDYAKAEPLYRQALEIRKRVLGENHPDYANSLNNLAMLYQAHGGLREGRAALPPGPGDRQARRWARTTPTMPPA